MTAKNTRTSVDAPLLGWVDDEDIDSDSPSPESESSVAWSAMTIPSSAVDGTSPPIPPSTTVISRGWENCLHRCPKQPGGCRKWLFSERLLSDGPESETGEDIASEGDDEDDSEENTKRKPSRSLSQTVMGIGRRWKRRVSSWSLTWLVRKDSTVEEGDGLLTEDMFADDNARGAIPRDLTSPYSRVCTSNDGASGVPLLGREICSQEQTAFLTEVGQTRSASGFVLGGVSLSDEVNAAIHALYPAHRAVTPPYLDVATTSRSEERSRMVGLTFAVQEAARRGKFDESKIDQRFESCLGSKVDPIVQKRAADSWLQSLHEEKESMDRTCGTIPTYRKGEEK